eukprot:TRINITY_DN94614_c0_g1_i1.p1 TRINITY_DN94614_c0_g1~~TRINITY_DN94614_c0_g1_i1.p1  ORF type:complete len:224 (-),score=40.42 TRINITY_DN94614_c0_g1_i1:71-742(-)
MSYGYGGYGGYGGGAGGYGGGPLGTMQAAALPTQAVGASPFGTQNFGAAAMPTQNVGDPFSSMPAAMRTQPGAFGASPMMTQPSPLGTQPQSYYGQGSSNSYGSGYGSQGYGGAFNPMATMPQNYSQGFGGSPGGLPPTQQLSPQELAGRNAPMQSSFVNPAYPGAASGSYGQPGAYGQPGYGMGPGGYASRGMGGYGNYPPGYPAQGAPTPMGRRARRSVCC